MEQIRSFGVHGVPRIKRLSRRTPSMRHKVQPFVEKEEAPCTEIRNTSPPPSDMSNQPVVEKESVPCMTTTMNTFLPDTPPRTPLNAEMSNQPIVQISDPQNDPIKTNNLPILNDISSMPTSNEPIHDAEEVEKSDYNLIDWIRNLSFKEKKILKRTIISLVIISALIAIIVPMIYLFAFPSTQSSSSSENTNTSICSASTCIGQETPYRSSIVTTHFTLDGHNRDQTGYISAFMMSPATTSYIQCYLTEGISFTLGSLQYLQALDINLTQKSFTIQFWLFIQSFASSNDFGLFGQCDAYNVCLSISLRNTRVTVSLDSMNMNNNTLIGTAVIILSSFTHISVVYDITISQLRIYVNGRVDAVSSGVVNAYQGNPASVVTTIGRSSSYAYSDSYFIGRLDHLTISSGTARNTCQILNDASIVVYYPFSTTDPFNDYGAHLCHGIGSRVSIISSGRIGQAISFLSTSSYFQAQCFPRTRNTDDSFSISMWINPNSIAGGSILHLSTIWSGNGTCYDLLGLTASGEIVLQWIMSISNVNYTQGPTVQANTWTHVAVVYQWNKGIRLYINGQLSGSSSNTGNFYIYIISGAPLPWYMTFGNNSPLGPTAATNCLSSSSIVPGAFSGAIDEFRLFNRELDYQELCTLANP